MSASEQNFNSGDMLLYINKYYYYYSRVRNCKSDAYKIGPDPKTTIMVWACDSKGRDPHNKKHVEYDGDGNPTQRTSKDEMA